MTCISFPELVNQQVSLTDGFRYPVSAPTVQNHFYCIFNCNRISRGNKKRFYVGSCSDDRSDLPALIKKRAKVASVLTYLGKVANKTFFCTTYSWFFDQKTDVGSQP